MIKIKKFISKGLYIIALFTFLSCYDYSFKEEQLAGKIYLVYAEDVPEYYTIKLKNSENYYTPLINEKVKELYKSKDAIYVRTLSSTEKDNYYFIMLSKQDEVVSIKQNDFDQFLKTCIKCTEVSIPKP